MCTGEIPTAVKEGFITPLFKSGETGDPANYRPVTVTSHIIKTFERVICGKVIWHLEDTQKLLKNQHGFKSGKSCVLQLLQCRRWLLNGLTNGSHLDVICIDFSKAFDKMDHSLLVEKTYQIGIRGRLIK